jgi:hypothetical protein
VIPGDIAVFPLLAPVLRGAVGGLRRDEVEVLEGDEGDPFDGRVVVPGDDDSPQERVGVGGDHVDHLDFQPEPVVAISGPDSVRTVVGVGLVGLPVPEPGRLAPGGGLDDESEERADVGIGTHPGLLAVPSPVLDLVVERRPGPPEDGDGPRTVEADRKRLVARLCVQRRRPVQFGFVFGMDAVGHAGGSDGICQELGGQARDA